MSRAWTVAIREQRALLHSLLQEPAAAPLPPEPGPDAQLWRRENEGLLA
jgi:hypothetical protein